MSVDEQLEKFFSLEEAVEALLQRLERLHDEADRFDRATADLQSAAESLQRFFDELTGVTRGIGDAIAVMRTIDTPSLLAGQQEIAERFRGFEEVFTAAQVQLGDLANAVADQLQAVPGELATLSGKFEALADGTARLDTDLANLVAFLTQRTRDLAQTVTDRADRLDTALANLGSSLDRGLEQVLTAAQAQLGDLANAVAGQLQAVTGELAALSGKLEALADGTARLDTGLANLGSSLDRGLEQVRADQAALREEVRRSLLELRNRVFLAIGGVGLLVVATLGLVIVRT